MHYVKDYLNSLKEGNLLGFECNSCKHRWLTIQNFCPNCGSHDIKDTYLSKRGKIVTYTILDVVPTNFKDKAPYAIAIIELEDGSRIQARIENIKDKDLLGRDVTFEKGDEEGLLFKLE
ncbi:MAG: Zn-ribbon domain-containing OB-fold protein [Thermoplasmata archaeon]